MHKIIEEYGGVIIAVLVVLAIIGIATLVITAVTTGTQTQLQELEKATVTTSSVLPMFIKL